MRVLALAWGWRRNSGVLRFEEGVLWRARSRRGLTRFGQAVRRVMGASAGGRVIKSRVRNGGCEKDGIAPVSYRIPAVVS